MIVLNIYWLAFEHVPKDELQLIGLFFLVTTMLEIVAMEAGIRQNGLNLLYDIGS